MTLKEEIDRDFIEAYKAQKTDLASVLRLLRNSIKNFEINTRTEANDTEVLKILKKEVKQRNDSASEFTKAGRSDLAQKEELELEIISKYLPEQLSEDRVREIIASTIEETGATTSADFGKVMGKALEKMNGQADGALVANIVRQLLQNK